MTPAESDRRDQRHPPRLPLGPGNIQTSIDQIATPLSAIGLVSLVALLWGATGMMASIRLGLEAAMKVDRGDPPSGRSSSTSSSSRPPESS